MLARTDRLARRSLSLTHLPLPPSRIAALRSPPVLARTQTHALIPSTTLDLEPRRILFSAPSAPSHPALSLDLDLSHPDAQIERAFGADAKSARAALELKRQRALDVDGARAEWRVAEGALVIYA